MKYKYFFLLFITQLLVNCGNSSNSNDENIKNDVKAFADAYFNYQFTKAAKYCTPESERWLKYASSNIHEADVEVLRNADEGASVKINNIYYHDDDSTGTTSITVDHYMRIDTIGNAGHIIKEAVYKLQLVIRNGKWLIKMEDLPRSEKQSRDLVKDE